MQDSQLYDLVYGNLIDRLSFGIADGDWSIGELAREAANVEVGYGLLDDWRISLETQERLVRSGTLVDPPEYSIFIIVTAYRAVVGGRQVVYSDSGADESGEEAVSCAVIEALVDSGWED